jgi:hypothetical protein
MLKINPKQFALSSFPDYNLIFQNDVVCAIDNTCFIQQRQKSEYAAVNNLPVKVCSVLQLWDLPAIHQKDLP